MNPFIDAQLGNMKQVTKTFMQSCEMAALQDDNTIAKNEEKTLKIIRRATASFLAELEKAVKSNGGFLNLSAPLTLFSRFAAGAETAPRQP